MSQQPNHAFEVQQELVKLGVISVESSLVSYNQIEGGGTLCIFFEICFENPSIKFIQKIDAYNTSSDVKEEYEVNLKYEYNNQKTLFENEINVPKPYFLKLIPNTRNLPYFVMEKIEGIKLVDVKGRNPDQYEQLIEKLIKELYKIHTLDPQLFPAIPIPNIQDNPFVSIETKLEIFKLYLDAYPEDLIELKPVYEWLNQNKTHYPCEKLVITHGDYHSFNILVEENQDFKILDWSSLFLRDFRMDVAYTATTESYFDKKQTTKDRMKRVLMISNIYEQISGRKIEGLSYFMILGCFFNLIRIYSQMNNPNITGENEDTKDFFKIVSDYFLFLAEIIEQNCKTKLNQIYEYFKEIE